MSNSFNKNQNIKFTDEGGLAVRLINKTGAPSIKGTIAHVYDATAIDKAFILCPDDEPDSN